MISKKKRKSKIINKFKKGAITLSFHSKNLEGKVKASFKNGKMDFSSGERVENLEKKLYCANEMIYYIGRYCCE